MASIEMSSRCHLRKAIPLKRHVCLSRQTSSLDATKRVCLTKYVTKVGNENTDFHLVFNSVRASATVVAHHIIGTVPEAVADLQL